MLSVALGKMYVGSSPIIVIFLYVTTTVERVLAVAFGKIYVGSSPIIVIFLYVAPAVERVLAVAFGKKYGGSSPTIVKFLYVAPAVERVLAVAFGKAYVGSSPTIGIFLYVAPAVEHVLAVAFGKKLCWFEFASSDCGSGWLHCYYLFSASRASILMIFVSASSSFSAFIYSGTSLSLVTRTLHFFLPHFFVSFIWSPTCFVCCSPCSFLTALHWVDKPFMLGEGPLCLKGLIAYSTYCSFALPVEGPLDFAA